MFSFEKRSESYIAYIKKHIIHQFCDLMFVQTANTLSDAKCVREAFMSIQLYKKNLASVSKTFLFHNLNWLPRKYKVNGL